MEGVLLGFSKETEPIRCAHTRVCGIYYKELTNKIVDAEKSENISSQQQTGDQRADGIVPVRKPAGSAPKKSQYFTLSPKAGKQNKTKI